MRIKKINHRPAIAKKVLLILIIKIVIVVVAVYAAFFVFVNTKGKDILVAKLSDKYGVAASIESLVFRPPFNFEIVNFQCADVAFKRAIVSVNIKNPIDFPFDFDYVFIEGLRLTLLKDQSGWLLNPFITQNSAQSASGEPSLEDSPSLKLKAIPIHVSVKNLVCREATVDYTYVNSRKQKIPLTFDSINFRVSNFAYPSLPVFSFDLSALLRPPLKTPDNASAITLKGWVDYRKKDMDTALKVSDYDYNAWGNYYAQAWRPKNLGLSQAVLSLDTTLHSRDNDLLIDLLFTLEKIRFSEAKDEASTARTKILRNTIGHFKKDDQQPQYRFKARTKMDSPEQFLPDLLRDLRGALPIGPAIIAEAAIEKTQETISQSAGQVFEKTKQTIDKSVEGVKKITIDATLGAIDGTVETLKSIISPAKKEDAGADTGITQ